MSLLKNAASNFGFHVETINLAAKLKPDHVGEANALPFEHSVFDVTCSFQMLEHLPNNFSLDAFREMVRISKKAIIISRPDAEAFSSCKFGFQKWRTLTD